MRNQTYSFPIRAYAVFFMVIGIGVLTTIAITSVSQLALLQQQTSTKTVSLARDELQQSLTALAQQVEQVARRIANWDETHQQFANSTYYAYWRENRLKNVKYMPYFITNLEIYDRHGALLGSPADSATPIDLNSHLARMPAPTGNSAFILTTPDSDQIYYFSPITVNSSKHPLRGYLLLQFSLLNALTSTYQYHYIAPGSMELHLTTTNPSSLATLTEHIQFLPRDNADLNALQTLMIDTVIRFSVAIVILSMLFGIVLFISVGLPLQRLAQELDRLRGKTAAQPTHKLLHRLSVTEFEKVKLSLIEYQQQVDAGQTALRKSEAQKRAVLDNVTDGIITMDSDYVIESANPASARIFATQNLPLIGSYLTEWLSQDCLPTFNHYRNRIQQLQENDHQLAACELTGVRKDGSTLPIELALSKIFLDGQRRLIGLIRDISARKQSEKHLQFLANYDGLTALPNRELFRDRLEHAITRTQRNAKLVGILLIDLDRFKTINDTFGHTHGDQLLFSVADQLKRCVRQEDTVARLGGDEFAIIIEGLKQTDLLAKTAQRIVATMTLPFEMQHKEIFLGASVGITVYPTDATSIDHLLKNADTAMYRAKERGGSCYQFFTSDMNRTALERFSIESELHRALERDEFCLYYQPRVDVHSKQATGCEALIRWIHPTKGLIPPDQFIPILEETGLIVAVGEWVLTTACQQTIQWQQQGYSNLRMAVNLSARQFKDQNLVRHVDSVLSNTGLAAANLELEITESLLIDDIDAAIKILQQLHQKGIKISVDDFGTGHSSLGYLKRFAIDTLKLDRSFIRDTPHNPEDTAIVTAIVALARSLHLNVTAEGIETIEQLAFIEQLDCDEAQGFYFSKPLPSSEFESWLAMRTRVTKQPS